MGALSVALLLTLGACADPSYGDAATPRSDGSTPNTQRDSSTVISSAGGDAGPSQVSQEDAGGERALEDAGPTVRSIPAWGMPLLGQYAVRSFAVKQDDFQMQTGGVTRSELLLLVTFASGANGMQLRSTLCSSVATSGNAELLLVDPRNLPERVENVLFSETGEQFSTEPSTFALGYSAELPAVCKNKLGNSVTHPADQTWFATDTCRCAILPARPSADDCRVLDPDGDKHPGSTYKLTTTLPPSVTMIYAGQADESHYVNGRVDPTGALHAANISALGEQYQFGCSPADCLKIDKLGEYCSASYNTAKFARLDADSAPASGYKCADVIAQKATLFTDAPPALDANCQ